MGGLDNQTVEILRDAHLESLWQGGLHPGLGLRLHTSGRGRWSSGLLVEPAITVLVKSNFLIPSPSLWPHNSDKHQLDSHPSHHLEQKFGECPALQP